MKIDINKKYISGGKPVEYLHRVPEGFKTPYPWRGMVDGSERCWTDAGWILAGDQHECDLVEIREPREFRLVAATSSNSLYDAGYIDTEATKMLREKPGYKPDGAWEIVRVREIID